MCRVQVPDASEVATAGACAAAPNAELATNEGHGDASSSQAPSKQGDCLHQTDAMLTSGWRRPDWSRGRCSMHQHRLGMSPGATVVIGPPGTIAPAVGSQVLGQAASAWLTLFFTDSAVHPS
eukprot:363986-Chlamydomonas_euryale.AAC.8